MNFSGYLKTLQEWGQAVWQCEWSRGFIYGILFCLVLKVLFLFLRLFHRRKRCSEVRISGTNGDIIISRRALTMAISAEMTSFEQIEQVESCFYLEHKRYWVRLSCSLKHGCGDIPMQELKEKITVAVTEKLASIFNITNLAGVELHIEDYTFADKPLQKDF